MNNQQRFENARHVQPMDRGIANDIAHSLADPFTILHDVKSDEYYIAFDTERGRDVEEL